MLLRGIKLFIKILNYSRGLTIKKKDNRRLGVKLKEITIRGRSVKVVERLYREVVYSREGLK